MQYAFKLLAGDRQADMRSYRQSSRSGCRGNRVGSTLHSYLASLEVSSVMACRHLDYRGFKSRSALAGT